MTSAKLKTDNVERFLAGGNATFTIVSVETGTRFTYKVRRKENDDGTKTPFFVSVLSGQDNERDYSYFGFIRDDVFYHGGRKARVGIEAKSAIAFAWFWRNRQSQKVEIWHEGRCARCGRKLTVPESIEDGFGPTCKSM